MKSRLQKNERYDQLLDLANVIIHEEGTEALTLIALADKAGITKPITYRHFGNRKSLLYALFQQAHARLSSKMDVEIGEKSTCLSEAIDIFAHTYIQCISEHGLNLFATISALKAYPDYEEIDLELQSFFCHTLRASLQPFLPEQHAIPETVLTMIFGATCCLGSMFLKQMVTEEEMFSNIKYLIHQLLEGDYHG